MTDLHVKNFSLLIVLVDSQWNGAKTLLKEFAIKSKVGTSQGIYSGNLHYYLSLKIQDVKRKRKKKNRIFLRSCSQCCYFPLAYIYMDKVQINKVNYRDFGGRNATPQNNISTTEN